MTRWERVLLWLVILACVVIAILEAAGEVISSVWHKYFSQIKP